MRIQKGESAGLFGKLLRPTGSGTRLNHIRVVSSFHEALERAHKLEWLLSKDHL